LIEGTLRENIDPFANHTDKTLIDILVDSNLYNSITIKEEMDKIN